MRKVAKHRQGTQNEHLLNPVIFSDPFLNLSSSQQVAELYRATVQEEKSRKDVETLARCLNLCCAKGLRLPLPAFPCSAAVFCLQVCTLSLNHWEDAVAMFPSLTLCPCPVPPAPHPQSPSLLCQVSHRKWLTLVRESPFFPPSRFLILQPLHKRKNKT